MQSELVILLVEDDENDAIVTQRALRTAGVILKIIHLDDGEKAINYLSGVPPYNDRAQYPLPALVLLDLKMPKFSGFEVLDWLRSQRALAKIPVVVLTGSLYPEDRKRAEELGAVGFEVKPVEFDQIVAIAKGLKRRLPEPP
jgi:CheY-like chemotaxis protein